MTAASGPGEPVVISHAITAALAALVSTGWAVIPNHNIDTIASAAGLVIAGVVTVLTRDRVTPGRSTLLGEIEHIVTEALTTQLEQYTEPVEDTPAHAAGPAGAPIPPGWYSGTSVGSLGGPATAPTSRRAAGP